MPSFESRSLKPPQHVFLLLIIFPLLFMLYGWNRVVEMIVDLQLSENELDGNLTFEIKRGHIGGTRVELYRPEASAFDLIQSLRWYGVSGGNRNVRVFTIPTDLLLREDSP